MKKIIAMLLALALCFALCACGAEKAEEPKAEAPAAEAPAAEAPAAEEAASGNPVVKIGVFEPQTGDNGAGGKQEILGMQYANSVQPTVVNNLF